MGLLGFNAVNISNASQFKTPHDGLSDASGSNSDSALH
jgi:hypothetical protein